MRFLVVDDFSTIRKIMTECLNEIGYDNIVEAEDGEQAWEVLSQEKIDFIISDWYMPRMSGVELLRKVRLDDTLKDLPFLMVTTEGSQDNVIEAVQMGVDNYINKPFKTKTIRKKINKILEQKQPE